MLPLVLAALLQTAPPPPAVPAPPKPKPNPCAGAAHHAFDFWVGKWDVTPYGGGPLVAHSLIESLYGGCAIRENWMPLKGTGGGSLTIANAAAQTQGNFVPASRIAFPAPQGASGDAVVAHERLNVAEPAVTASGGSGAMKALGFLLVIALIAGAFYAGARFKERIPFLATKAQPAAAPTRYTCAVCLAEPGLAERLDAARSAARQHCPSGAELRHSCAPVRRSLARNGAERGRDPAGRSGRTRACAHRDDARSCRPDRQRS